MSEWTEEIRQKILDQLEEGIYQFTDDFKVYLNEEREFMTTGSAQYRQDYKCAMGSGNSRQCRAEARKHMTLKDQEEEFAEHCALSDMISGEFHPDFQIRELCKAKARRDGLL